MISRRQLLNSLTATCALPFIACDSATRSAADEVAISGFDLVPVRATDRTVWLFLQLRTNVGLTGIGEASNAFGSANTTTDNVATMHAAVEGVLAAFNSLSPLAVPLLRQQARSSAQRNRISATAFSAIEQAMWDLSGQLFNAPVWQLLGARQRDTLPVYANINRAVQPRTAERFAALASQARADGFSAVKAAPFDSFPVNGTNVEIAAHIDAGISATVAMREAIGDDAALMIDCHSFFSVEQAIAVAQALEPVNLTWYEEPVAPQMIEQSLSIKRGIPQQLAGGELLFGVEGFAPLIERNVFDVIMPDVKHCGGLTELMQIAELAAANGVFVSPHNPSGPVSTMASVHAAACMENFNYMELQYGEVSWRSEILNPAETFVDGTIAVPEAPGLGVELNEKAIDGRY